MIPPPLRTERLRLSPFEQKHLTKRYVSWLNDPEVVRYSEQRHRTHSISSCQDFVKRFDTGPNHFWAIEEAESGTHIGNITTECDVPNSVADIQILLGDRTAWGRGYGAEAWAAVMRYLFETGYRKITAGTMSENHGMRRIMEKCGMAVEGVRKAQFLLNGQTVDLIHAAAFAGE